MSQVGPAVLGSDRGEAHVDPLPRAPPRRIGHGEPGHAAAVRRARDHHALRVDPEERVLGEQAREVLEVVHLVGAVPELRLARRTAAARVHEAARRVRQHDVAARGEPGVVVVPLLAARVDRPVPVALRPVAAVVQQDDQRVAAARAGMAPRVGQRDVRVESDEPLRVGAGVRVGRDLARQARVARVSLRDGALRAGRPRWESGRRPAAGRRRRSGTGSERRSSAGRRARPRCGSSPSARPGRPAPRRAGPRRPGRAMRRTREMLRSLGTPVAVALRKRRRRAPARRCR